jgi:hypothetical protein
MKVKELITSLLDEMTKTEIYEAIKKEEKKLRDGRK